MLSNGRIICSDKNKKKKNTIVETGQFSILIKKKLGFHPLLCSNKLEILTLGLIFFFRPADITDEEYNEFYKTLSKDHDKPLAKVHFTAEGEVTFKSILYVPKASPQDMFQNYGKNIDHIKVSLYFL